METLGLVLVAALTRAQHLNLDYGLAPGDLIGPYTVDAPLGEGGMGCVYRAVGPGGECVALKLIRADLAAERVFRRRFDREGQAALRVEHPHVVQVVDTGEHEGIPYMAQRFIGGGSLQDKLDREGQLSLETVVTMCLQIAKGLGAIHEHNLIHRDLKPANILLDEEGSAFVGDFGLAKDTQGSLLTQPGAPLGSLHYMAPEQIQGEEVTPATDVYALGCVVHQCLSGRPPFGDRRSMAILWAHISDDPPDPCAARDDLPKDLGWAVASALAKDPARRPPTAIAYARIVQAAAGSPPLSPQSTR